MAALILRRDSRRAPAGGPTQAAGPVIPGIARASSRRRGRVGTPGRCLFIGVALAAWAAAADAEPSFVITKFPIPTPDSGPRGIVTGPDGNLWFTEKEGNKIGRITPSGAITEFPLPMPFSAPEGIAAGPDGNLWFTEESGNRIGRITPAGVISEFPVPTPDSQPKGITSGGDGNLWFTEVRGNKIGRITPSGVISEFPLPRPGQPRAIASGPDGNLWFTESDDRIGQITPAGEIAEFPAFGVPEAITAGPDGNLWFTQVFGNRIARLTPAGVITEFYVHHPGAPFGPIFCCFSPVGITQGPDGNLWFTAFDRIGRITPAGTTTQFPLDTHGTGITGGPDGAVWFTERFGNKIGRITASSPGEALSISPPSGVYALTQQFDLVFLMRIPGQSIIGGAVIVNNAADVTALVARCLVLGTLAAGGQTLRCPGPGAASLGPGRHTVGVVLDVADGSRLSQVATLEVLANSEP